MKLNQMKLAEKDGDVDVGVVPARACWFGYNTGMEKAVIYDACWTVNI